MTKRKIVPSEWYRSNTLIIFMDNWGHKIVPKHLVFVICWQFNQLSCLSSSIFNGPPSKNATPSFVWEGCLHSVMPCLAYPFLPSALHQCTSSSFFLWHLWDGTHSNTPERLERKEAAVTSQHTALTMPVVPAAASFSLLRSLRAPPWSCFPPVALTEIQRLAVNDLSLV